MKTAMLTLVALLLTKPADLVKPGALDNKALAALQGKWQLTRVTKNGQHTFIDPATKPTIFVIQADALTFDKEYGESSLKVFADGSHIEIADKNGKKKLGVYRIIGQEWSLAIFAPGRGRPEAIDAPGVEAWVFRRLKE